MQKFTNKIGRHTCFALEQIAHLEIVVKTSSKRVLRFLRALLIFLKFRQIMRMIMPDNIYIVASLERLMLMYKYLMEVSAYQYTPMNPEWPQL